MSKPIYEDPVVAEIHSVREKMLSDCDGDHQKLMENISRSQAKSGHQIIKAPAVIQIGNQNPVADGESSPLPQ